jgi:hypothetical protein
MRVSCHATAALPPGKRPGTHCTGGLVGSRAGLNRCRKCRPHWDSIPGPSSPPAYCTTLVSSTLRVLKLGQEKNEHMFYPHLSVQLVPAPAFLRRSQLSRYSGYRCLEFSCYLLSVECRCQVSDELISY